MFHLLDELGVGKCRGHSENPFLDFSVLELGLDGVEVRQFLFQSPHVVVRTAELPVEFFGKDDQLFDLPDRPAQGRPGVPVEQKPEQAKGGHREGKGRLALVGGEYQPAAERKKALGVVVRRTGSRSRWGVVLAAVVF